MSYPQAFALSLIQGLTEFLPISSSGHLVILQKLFGFESPPILFDILVHIGTLGAILFYFRNRLLQILNGLKQRKKKAQETVFLIIVGTLPAAIAGPFLQNHLLQIFNSLELVGVSLLVTAGLLFSVKWFEPLCQRFNRLDWKDALFIGFFQALAILPGISRSGATIVSSLWRGAKREIAFRFSFYLAIPAILGALVLQIPDLASSPVNYLGTGVLGMIIAGIVGYIALMILENVLKSAKLFYFGFYCAILGILALLIQ